MRWPIVSVTALVLAVVASVFAIWPVVGSPPWETNGVQALPTKTECDVIHDRLTAAQTDTAARIAVAELNYAHCV
jgi:hypothetical protein